MALGIGRATPSWYKGESVKKNRRRIIGKRPGLGRATPGWTVKNEEKCLDSDLQSTDLDIYLDI